MVLAPRRLSLILTALLLITSITSRAASDERASPDQRTLLGDPTLPARQIQKVVSDEVWKSIRNREYVAYLVIDGTLDRRGRMSIRKVTSHPDESWAHCASEAMREVKVPPVSVGSHLDPRARAYVIIYSVPDGHLAVVYAEQERALVPRVADKSAYIGFVHFGNKPKETTPKPSSVPAPARLTSPVRDP